MVAVGWLVVCLLDLSLGGESVQRKVLRSSRLRLRRHYLVMGVEVSG